MPHFLSLTCIISNINVPVREKDHVLMLFFLITRELVEHYTWSISVVIFTVAEAIVKIGIIHS